MAIEKMLLVNIHGAMQQLDLVLSACSEAGCFHPESVSKLVQNSHAMTALAQDNPYTPLLERVNTMAAQAGLSMQYDPHGDFPHVALVDEKFLKSFQTRLGALSDRRRAIEEEITQQENALRHLSHLKGMDDVSLDELFDSRYYKVRFGRLPADSYPKLKFYENEVFFFHVFDFDGDYYWGFYITTEEFGAVIDNIFASLYFERLYIPNFAHGTPQQASESIQTELDKCKAQLTQLDAEKTALLESNETQFQQLYEQVTYLQQTHEVRKYVAISSDGENKTFHMVGFVPKREKEHFEQLIGGLDGVTVNFMPPETDKRFVSPTRLHNNVLVRPFEMFVTMYGLPSQSDIDPTPFVAITYSLLFGIMFGDLGQGLVLFVFGMFLSCVKKMQLGGIMARVGITSAIFGTLYGSVFGMEELLDPVYASLGISFLPIRVMDGATINSILMAAVAIGAVIIVLSILINIVQGIRQKNAERAVLDANGIAGLVMYVAILIGIVGQLFLNVKIFVPLYVVAFIIIPALLIFCKEPLLKLLRHAKSIKPEDGIGGFIAQSFFELFEVFLSFASNTMSFLRVGGFVLSHAGMMLVVFTLSQMMQNASVLVIVLGNIFVMALEGLIVGIQVLRLEFYEIFSRFFQGDGVPFEPIVFGAERTEKD